jgi:hypothetical protein
MDSRLDSEKTRKRNSLTEDAEKETRKLSLASSLSYRLSILILRFLLVSREGDKQATDKAINVFSPQAW